MNIEPLESRIAPATFTVTSNAGFGPGTLAEALSLAAGSMGTDTIGFNLAPGQTTIELDNLSASFLVESPVIIDGRTQPGYVDSPLVTISRGMSSSTTGFAFANGSDGSQLHGLTITGFPDIGVAIAASNILISGSTITGNQFGISVSGGNATIGGDGIAGRNVISGNSIYGIVSAFASGLYVQNSYIGLDRTGQAALPNGSSGIYIDGGFNFTIGGPDKNVISGNGGDAIHLVGVFGNVRVQNNYIGLYADGTFDGSSRNQSPAIFAYGAANFLIGKDGENGEPNRIANNVGRAIQLNTQGIMVSGSAIIAGNLIGLTTNGMFLRLAPNGGGIYAEGPNVRIGGADPDTNKIYVTGETAITTGLGPVEIRQNVFYSAPGAAVIDALDDGRTFNDANDSDGVPNFPVLAGAFRDAMGFYRAVGSIQSTPNTELTVIIYGHIPGEVGFYSPVGEIVATTNSAGTATFDAGLSLPLDGYGFVTATATNTAEKTTSEMSDPALVAPAIVFTDASPLAIAEGNAGATLVSFEIRMTSAPTQPVSVQLSAGAGSTATPGTDFSFSPSTLNFNATTTTQTVTVAITGERDVEPTEFINFVLSNLSGDAILLGGTKTLQINNDDTSLRVAADRKSATWKDVDGDLVTLKSTKAVLDAADFTFEAQGALGGEVLRILNLSNEGAAAKGAGLALTAKFDKVNNLGDGSVHIGYLNATGVDLGVVAIAGNLERISAGDATPGDGSLKSLTIGSMGLLGSNKLTDGGNYASDFSGKVGALTVRGDVRGARLTASGAAAGSFGAISILGNLETAGTTPAARITASGDITALKIGGSMISQTGSSLLVIADGKLGAVTIGRSMDGNGGFVRLIGFTTVGKVSVGGDMESAGIIAGGKARPANAAAALAIASVTVKGNVTDSLIAAGLGAGDHGNPDAQIGAITVGGDWSRSFVTAGIDIVNDFTIGDANDAVVVPTGPFTDNPAIVSKIASITIKGHIYGTAAAGDTFGFVAQSIGKFVRGTTAYTLRPNPVPNALPLDVFNVAITGDVFVREVI